MTITIPDIFTSWKSSLVGIGSAVLGVIQVSSYHGDWVSAIHDRSVQLAIAVAVLGFVSKDSGVTGGTIAATPEAAARVAEDKPGSVIQKP